MWIILIIIGVLWLIGQNKGPQQSSGSTSSQQPTTVHFNPPNFTQGSITTGPSREPVLNTWQQFQQGFFTDVYVPNTSNLKATGEAVSTTVQQQLEQVSVSPPASSGPANPGGSSSTTGPGNASGMGSTGASGGTGGTISFGCFSGNVKVQTSEGWKTFSELDLRFRVVNETGEHDALLYSHPDFSGTLLDMGHGLLATEDHVIKTPEGDWKKAGEVFPNAPRMEVKQPVYNIHVDSAHEKDWHYILENGVVAHNKQTLVTP